MSKYTKSPVEKHVLRGLTYFRSQHPPRAYGSVQYAATGRVTVSPLTVYKSRWLLDGLNPAGRRLRPPAGAPDAGKVRLVLELA